MPTETRHNQTSVLRKTQRCPPSGINSHFLKKVPVGDDFQLLEDEEDPAADEEGLVLDESFVQQQKVALTSERKEKKKPEIMISYVTASFVK